jgi:hypothetical protein
MLSVSSSPALGQIPLIQIVESDDCFLDEADILWFRLLRDLDWQPLVPVAVQYYEALWQFNQDQLRERVQKENSRPVPNPETKEEARQRLLLDRATLDPEKPVLAEGEANFREPLHVDPATIRPGQVPPRLRGRTPKDFFPMLKSFLGVMVMGRPAEPEFVFAELTNNPAFARTCGFTLPDADFGYRASDVPSLRKLEQFDQIMTANGLWGHLSVGQVRRNLESGKLGQSTVGVHDTTHHEAYSSREAPVVEGRTKNGKPLKKSHPKTTKPCRCPVWQDCPHDWISADEGAGTVVKAGRKMFWAHKASVFALVGEIEIPLDAVATTDAAAHDSRSLLAHLERIAGLYPGILEKIEVVLDDSALDDEAIRKRVKGCFDIDLRVEPNARGRKPILEELPRGIDRITPSGTPVCDAGFPFNLLGVRKQTEHFLFRAPEDSEGVPVCADCPERDGCIRPTAERRHLSIPCHRLPFMDPDLPHLSKRFERQMAKRTVVERIIKLMKFDFGSDQLTKRGTAAYQATLDKTLFAMHVVLADG